MEPIDSIRITLKNKSNDPGECVAEASFKLAGLFYLTKLRIINGKKGHFVNMPAKKNPQGEYQDIYFPASKEARDNLQEAVLAAYFKTLEGA